MEVPSRPSQEGRFFVSNITVISVLPLPDSQLETRGLSRREDGSETVNN